MDGRLFIGFFSETNDLNPPMHLEKERHACNKYNFISLKPMEKTYQWEYNMGVGSYQH